MIVTSAARIQSELNRHIKISYKHLAKPTHCSVDDELAEATAAAEPSSFGDSNVYK